MTDPGLAQIWQDLSFERASRHLRWMEANAPERISGTPDQIRAGEYIANQLSHHGLETHLDTFTGYRSVPLRASLDVLTPTQESHAAVACGHIVSTPDSGLETELVYVGGGSEGDYEGRDVRGLAVITEISEGPSRPVKARIAADRGAAAIIFASWGLPEYGTIPSGAIKCAWGNPTREMMSEIPPISALGISRSTGDALRSLVATGRVTARILAQATQDWGPMTQPWARVRATSNPTGAFLLVGGHYDAWRPGMTDNAAGNALTLELARTFFTNRDRLTRDVIFAFWNGHEVGDYEGSTWFADQYWDELDLNAVAYINVDSVGFSHSSYYLGDSTPELTEFHRRNERRVLGSDTGHRHLTRDNEHPFFGLGLPALEGRFHFSEAQIAEWGGARGGWWWHTTEDTLDKVDPGRYEEHARIYASYLWDMCTTPILPMDHSASAAWLRTATERMQAVAGERFDLALPVAAFEQAVHTMIKVRPGFDDRAGVARFNRALMRISRCLLPAFATAGGRYAQDRVGLEALKSPIPAVHELHLLGTAPVGSELEALLHTELVRARNRLSDALRGATREALEATA